MKVYLVLILFHGKCVSFSIFLNTCHLYEEIAVSLKGNIHYKVIKTSVCDCRTCEVVIQAHKCVNPFLYFLLRLRIWGNMFHQSRKGKWLT